MAKLVKNHVEQLNKLEEIIKESSENILTVINLDELLKDPEGYMLTLGDTFLKEHIDEISKASKIGSKFAKKVLNEI